MASHDSRGTVRDDWYVLPRLALVLCALAVTLAVVGGMWHVANGDLSSAAGVNDWWVMGVVGAVAFGVPGGWLAQARPQHPLGWLFLGMGAASGLSLVATEYGLTALDTGRPGATGALWLGNWLWVAAIVPVASVVPLLLPDGRVLSPAWRPALLLGVLAAAAGALSFAVAPYDATTPALTELGLENPVGNDVLSDPAVSALTTLLILSGAVTGVSGLMVRWRRSADEREQLKWVVLGVAAAIGLFALGFWLGPAFSALAMLPLPLAVVWAVLRHGMVDVDVVISRSVLYAALTACLVALYLVVVGVVGWVLGSTAGDSRTATVVATALVALAVEPLHRRLRTQVNRVVHGDAEDPYAVLIRLGDRLAAASAPDDLVERVLPAVVEQVARSLRADRAVLVLTDGTTAAYGAAGARAAHALAVDLHYAGRRLGTITVERSAPFTTATREALDRLAGQAAVAAHTVMVARENQRAREAVVLAREEERRRLRRDLHDGVGPSLAALALQVETARELAAEDPAAATALLDRLAPRMNATVGDVRALVHELRPPTLDELGLGAAVRELGDRMSSPTTRVETEVEPLTELPAAVEVAAYHIAGEAIGNAVRHAGATRVRVRLTQAAEHLAMEVVDDGGGIPRDVRPGVGTFSMRERVDELGGHLDVVSGPTGTRVTALLPRVAT